jgi:hypothetical protein
MFDFFFYLDFNRYFDVKTGLLRTYYGEDRFYYESVYESIKKKPKTKDQTIIDKTNDEEKDFEFSDAFIHRLIKYYGFIPAQVVFINIFIIIMYIFL